MARPIGLTDDIEAMSVLQHYSAVSDNKEQLEYMKKLIKNAMNGSLTGRQYDCVVMYYVHNMTTTKIAETLGIAQSTVTRHLQAARKKLKMLENLRMGKM